MPHRVPGQQREPNDRVMLSALALAARAPSVHNSQPWRWRLDSAGLHLHADPSRLPVAESDCRDVLMSCGAVLHHLRVAFAALGWACEVRRLPDPGTPDHLAVIALSPRRATRDEIDLVSAIPRRRTDRRRYGSWEMPPGLLDVLARDATVEGADLLPVTEPAARHQLVSAIAEAEELQDADWELASWTGRPGTEPAGTRTRTVGADRPVRDLPATGIEQPVGVSLDRDVSTLTVLGTVADDRLSWLRAGEAASSVLLRATSIGLASCALSRPRDHEEIRDLVGTRILGIAGYPQLILRLGWAHPHAGPLPATQRRPLSEFVDGVAL